MKNLLFITIMLFVFNTIAQDDTTFYELVENDVDYSYFGGGLGYDVDVTGYNV
jgi:hypothetical protein